MKMTIAAAVAVLAVAPVRADGDCRRTKYAEREVIRPDSFTMLNIIPCRPGSEAIAAADAAEFAERTGNPYCL